MCLENAEGLSAALHTSMSQSPLREREAQLPAAAGTASAERAHQPQGGEAKAENLLALASASPAEFRTSVVSPTPESLRPPPPPARAVPSPAHRNEVEADDGPLVFSLTVATSVPNDTPTSARVMDAPAFVAHPDGSVGSLKSSDKVTPPQQQQQQQQPQKEVITLSTTAEDDEEEEDDDEVVEEEEDAPTYCIGEEVVVMEQKKPWVATVVEVVNEMVVKLKFEKGGWRVVATTVIDAKLTQRHRWKKAQRKLYVGGRPGRTAQGSESNDTTTPSSQDSSSYGEGEEIYAKGHPAVIGKTAGTSTYRVKYIHGGSDVVSGRDITRSIPRAKKTKQARNFFLLGEQVHLVVDGRALLGVVKDVTNRPESYDVGVGGKVFDMAPEDLNPIADLSHEGRSASPKPVTPAAGGRHSRAPPTAPRGRVTLTPPDNSSTEKLSGNAPACSPTDSDATELSLKPNDEITVNHGGELQKARVFRKTNNNQVVVVLANGATKVVNRNCIVRGSRRPEEAQRESEELPNYSVGDIVIANKGGKSRRYRVVIVHAEYACYQIVYWSGSDIDVARENEILGLAPTVATSSDSSDDGYRVGDLVLCRDHQGSRQVCRISVIDRSELIVKPVRDRNGDFSIHRKDILRVYLSRELGECKGDKVMKQQAVARKGSGSDEAPRFRLGDIVRVRHNGVEAVAMIRCDEFGASSYQVSIQEEGTDSFRRGTQNSQRGWVIVQKENVLGKVEAEKPQKGKRKRGASPDEAAEAQPSSEPEVEEPQAPQPKKQRKPFPQKRDATPSVSAEEAAAPQTAPAVIGRNASAAQPAQPPKLPEKKKNKRGKQVQQEAFIAPPTYPTQDTLRGRCFLVAGVEGSPAAGQLVRVAKEIRQKGGAPAYQVQRLEEVPLPEGSPACGADCHYAPQSMRVEETDRYITLGRESFTPESEVHLFHEHRLRDMHYVISESTSGTPVEAGGRYCRIKPSAARGVEKVVRILGQSESLSQVQVRYCLVGAAEGEDEEMDGCGCLLPRSRRIVETEEEGVVQVWQILAERIEAVPQEVAQRIRFHSGQRRCEDGGYVEGDRDVNFQGRSFFKDGRHQWRACMLGKTLYFKGAAVRFVHKGEMNLGEICMFIEEKGVKKVQVLVLHQNDPPMQHTVSTTYSKFTVPVKNIKSMVNVISYTGNDMPMEEDLDTYRYYDPKTQASLALFCNTAVESA